MEDVRKAINKLKIGKSPRIDNITPEMIQYMATEGIKQFTKLTRKIMKNKKISSIVLSTAFFKKST